MTCELGGSRGLGVGSGMQAVVRQGVRRRYDAGGVWAPVGDVHAVVGFFFQAEGGIRDLVRSRGLGDVYKRQFPHRRLSRGHRRNPVGQ